ncbi:MAG: phosphatidate cytidylyltransferase [Bacteroidales bacterium]|nr:phosphatidate cytidylyltransferase [Bacteroidales bacterium]MCF8390240.1 phosphatidate cytidylyltransferase [Bacteroidales bacterium]
MKEFYKRSLSGVFFVLIILVAVYAHILSLYVLLLVVLIFSLNEFYTLLFKLKFLPYKLFGITAAMLLFTLNFLVAINLLDPRFLLLNLFFISLLPIIPLFYHTKSFVQSWATTLIGWIYIVIPMSAFAFISQMTGKYEPVLIMSVFIIIWTFDSFAYLSGSLLGKHKMFPGISPKKSWEGFAGGLLLSLVLVFFLSPAAEILSRTEWLLLTVVIVITGTLGDLIESGIKRNVGVKDSGKFLPGHGGFLDRFDSLLFALPFVYLYLIFVI